MKPIICNGWALFFHPLFFAQRSDLVEKGDFITHPSVKLLKEKKIIMILWLGFPRKEEDKKDCYQVFSKKIAQGQFPDSLANLLAECQTEDSLTNEKENY